MDDSEITISPTASSRLLHFEDCKIAVDQLFADSLSAQGASAFDDFLNFVAYFNDMSIYNAMLVRIQRPGAGAVASRRKWESIGRYIRPGAIPIVVLRPFGPVGYVFEQNDTAGEPLPGESSNPLFATGMLCPRVYKQVCESAEKHDINVNENQHYGALLAGTASGMDVLPLKAIEISENDNTQTRVFFVEINAQHDLPTKFATLAHELGHIYCGHVGADSKGRWPSRIHLNRAQKELEAEAVSWLVCQRQGIKTKSRDYLSSLIRGVDLSTLSLYAILNAANRIEPTSPSAGR